MNKLDEQITLYAKNYYEKTDTLSDLRTIISYVNETPDVCLTNEQILSHTISVVFRVLKKCKTFNDIIVQNIIMRSTPSMSKSLNKEYNFYMSFCDSLLFELKSQPCYDDNNKKILEMGNLDPAIMPIAQDNGGYIL